MKQCIVQYFHLHVCSLFNHIKLSSELRQGCDYSLFKSGIRPMWEDDANKRGGRWLINLDKKQRTVDLDRFWLDVIDQAILSLQLSLRLKGTQYYKRPTT